MVDNHLTIGDTPIFHEKTMELWEEGYAQKMMGFPSLGSMLNLRGGCEILLETNWKEKEKEVGKYFAR